MSLVHMLPSSSGYPSASTSLSDYPSVQPNFAYTNQQSFLPPTLQDQSLHQGDLNSPEAFKQNIQIVQQNVARLHNLASNILSGIQNAYHPGSSPTQTEADMTTLKQTIQLLCDMMRVTGVGGLPLLSMPIGSDASSTTSTIPTEEQMMADTTRAVQELYEKLKRSQESAAVVANLLATPDQAPRAAKRNV